MNVHVVCFFSSLLFIFVGFELIFYGMDHGWLLLFFINLV
jgi:hypothetical protein